MCLLMLKYGAKRAPEGAPKNWPLALVVGNLPVFRLQSSKRSSLTTFGPFLDHFWSKKKKKAFFLPENRQKPPKGPQRAPKGPQKAPKGPKLPKYCQNTAKIVEKLAVGPGGNLPVFRLWSSERSSFLKIGAKNSTSPPCCHPTIKSQF